MNPSCKIRNLARPRGGSDSVNPSHAGCRWQWMAACRRSEVAIETRPSQGIGCTTTNKSNGFEISGSIDCKPATNF